MENNINKEEILKLREQGLTIAKIAKKLNCSLYRVYSRLNTDYEPKKLNKE